MYVLIYDLQAYYGLVAELTVEIRKIKPGSGFRQLPERISFETSAHNPRLEPEGPILVGRAVGVDPQDEYHRFTGQRWRGPRPVSRCYRRRSGSTKQESVPDRRRRHSSTGTGRCTRTHCKGSQ